MDGVIASTIAASKLNKLIDKPQREAVYLTDDRATTTYNTVGQRA